MGEFLWGGGAKCPWVNFNGYKYSVRNIKSINIIIVYILPSCQLQWNPFLKANTVQQDVEISRKLKANTVQRPVANQDCSAPFACADFTEYQWRRCKDDDVRSKVRLESSKTVC